MLAGEISRMIVAGEFTRRSLLKKLQEIWDEVGESNDEIYVMLVQMERECLDVYERVVERAEKSREQLLLSLSGAKNEVSSLVSALGDKTLIEVLGKTTGSIKEQLAAITPICEQLQKQKTEREKEFYDVRTQIQRISAEIAGTINERTETPILDESDLCRKKLDEYQSQLKILQKEKSDRLQKVLGSFSTVHELCSFMGMDFLSTLTKVYPSVNGWKDILSKTIGNECLSKLTETVVALKEVKKQRLSELRKLVTQIMDLWHLLDTPDEERKLMDHLTRIMSVSVDEAMVHGDLAPDLIQQAAAEVERLNKMKASKIMEIAIAFKRQTEDEEINVHGNREISPDPAGEELATEGVSHKNMLKEYARRLYLPFPTYQIIHDGLPNAPKPPVKAIVCVGESYSSQQTFLKRKDAEQDAARVALKCIKEKIRMEKFPLLYEDPALCKSILNAFAAKMKLEMPTYDILASGEKIKGYRSFVVFNSVTYTGDYAVSKKGAKHFGARAAILSLLGDPAYAMELSEIINSRSKISSSLSQVKDSCNNDEHGSQPAGVETYVGRVQPLTATHKALTDSTAGSGQVKQIFLPKRKQSSDQVGISNPSGVTEKDERYTKKKREANNTLQTYTLVRWVAPPIGKAKLNTDGSVIHRNCGLAAAGGVLRDTDGKWLGGFVANLGKADVLKAELSGLREGLLLAKLRGCRCMIVEVDSLSLTQLLLCDTKSHPLADILEECRVLMRELDVDHVEHTLREGNVCADFLASLGHSYPFGVHVLADPPLELVHHLLADMQAASWEGG